MGILDRLQRAFRELVGPPSPSPVRQSRARSEVTAMSPPRSGRTDASLLRAVAEQVPIVRAAINAKKRHAGALRFQVEGPDDAMCDFLAELLKSPAPGYSWRQWLSEVIEDVLVLDAACVYLWPTKSGGPYALLPIDAATISITPDDRGILPAPPATAYEQRIAGGLVASLTTDQLLYEQMNPRANSVYGLSPTEVVLHTTLALTRRMTLTVDDLDSSNVPAFFGEVPNGWTTAQIQEWQDYWDRMVEDRPHRGVWGPAGMNAQFPPRHEIDTSFDEYLLQLICAVFEVQPQELGFTTHVNRATGEVQEEITQRRSIRPMAELLSETVDQAFDIFGFEDYRLVFPELLARNRRDIREDARTFVSAGILTPNEIREDMGLAPLEGGDQLRQPAGFGTAVRGAAGDGGDVGHILKPLLRSATEIEIVPLGPDEDAILLAIEDAAVNSIIQAGLDLDLDALLDQIRERLLFEEVIDEQIVQQIADEIVAAHSDLLRPLTTSLIQMAQEGVTQAAFAFQEATNITLDWSLANADAADWARQYGYDLIQDLSGTTRRRIGSEIGAWIEAREDFPALVSRLRAIVADEGRAKLIASTEATRAYAEGNLFSWRTASTELDLVFVKEWRTARDDLVCPLCGPMDGQRSSLDGTTWIAPDGNESVGSSVTAPPMHPRCRCWLVSIATFGSD